MKNNKVSVFDVAQWSKMVKSQFEKNLPLCHEQNQARALWWKCQFSSMKNGKVNIFDVAQWSKLVKSQFEKKIRQAVCGENFSSLAWKMAKFVFLMLHSGQKWSKINLKKFNNCIMKKIRQGPLWWKFQLSSMKNCKVSIFDVTQWSKFVKSQFEKNLTTVFWKRSDKGCMVKISAL